MHFIPEELEDYAAEHSEKEPELLQQLRRETYQKILQPRMLSGHLQGRLLSIVSKLVNPKNILEIGTYTGYSALCLAEGLQPDGLLETIDHNEELAYLQHKYFKASSYASQIKTYVGDALKVIPTLQNTFDLVFIDADKPNYPAYFDLIIPKLNTGGLLISDNVLWNGKVLDPTKNTDPSTQAILKYNSSLANDDRLETVLLPIRDGLTLSRKK
ncbi:O-methyltransferase [Flavimarina sp. Hel_I_48]|uniref:O-methyltransferase n=1 Tax=Flavimarina sp. Hel_I_48 TaxID=1392488 RepID=UPI0004DEDEE8|nr:O-methyltransferase [Flavimarina sp. Hel_I_48]